MIEFLQSVIAKMQWTGRDQDFRPVCPLCRQGKRKGHKPDCAVGQALAMEGDCLRGTLAEIERKGWSWGMDSFGNITIVNKNEVTNGTGPILPHHIHHENVNTPHAAAEKALVWIKEVQGEVEGG